MLRRTVRLLGDILSAGFEFGDDFRKQRRVMVISSLQFIVFIVFSIFLVINLYHQEYLLVGLDIAVLSLIGVSFFLFYRLQQLDVAAYLCSATLFLFLVVFFYLNKNDSFGLVWVYAYPAFTIPLLGVRTGVRVNLLFYAIVLPMAYLGIDQWNHGYWDMLSFIRLLVSVLFFFAMTLLVEISFDRANSSLADVRRKEKEYARRIELISMTDKLTGIYNRRYLDQRLNEEVERVARSGFCSALLMLDIDRFKKVNDLYGHQAGDKVLQTIVISLQQALRRTDTLARWGGEEFVILMPDISIEQARVLAERARLAVQELAFEQFSGITLSVGIAVIDQSTESSSQVLGAADSALYRAKRLGRNRTELASVDAAE